MLCYRCGSPAEEGEFCRQCGARLQCPKCRAPWTEGCLFCNHCGALVEEPLEKPAEVPEIPSLAVPKKQKSWLPGVGLLLIFSLLFLGALGIHYQQGHSNKKPVEERETLTDKELMEKLKGMPALAPDQNLAEDALVGHWKFAGEVSRIEKIGAGQYRFWEGDKAYLILWTGEHYELDRGSVPVTFYLEGDLLERTNGRDLGYRLDANGKRFVRLQKNKALEDLRTLNFSELKSRYSILEEAGASLENYREPNFKIGLGPESYKCQIRGTGIQFYVPCHYDIIADKIENRRPDPEGKVHYISCFAKDYVLGMEQPLAEEAFCRLVGDSFCVDKQGYRQEPSLEGWIFGRSGTGKTVHPQERVAYLKQAES